MMVRADIARITHIPYNGKANKQGKVTFKRVKIKDIKQRGDSLVVTYKYLNGRFAFKQIIAFKHV